MKKTLASSLFLVALITQNANAVPYVQAGVAAQSNVAQTNTPGELVSASAFTPYNGGGALSSAAAVADYGANRISITSGYTSTGNGFGAADGTAFSGWRDYWTFSGPEGRVTFTVYGQVHFGLDGTDGFLMNLQFHGFTASMVFNTSVGSFTIDTPQFIAADSGFINWSATFEGNANSQIEVGEALSASGFGNTLFNIFAGQATDQKVGFDAMNTSRLTRIVAPTGYALHSASNELVATDGGYTYLAAVAAVPEPETLAMFVAGLSVLLIAARRRDGRTTP